MGEHKKSTVASSPALSEAYWAGAERGEVVLQRCTSCGVVRHYPRLLCSECYSFDTEPFTATGRGLVHSWTITHQVFDPDLAADVPYALVTVELDEGVRMLGRLAGGVDPVIGAPVTVGFRTGREGRPVPVFAVAGAGASSVASGSSEPGLPA